MVLPCKIALLSLSALVAVVVVFAPFFKWRRSKALLVSTLMALLAFVPSCLGLKHVVDRTRFGYFEYATFSDINDFRAQRYLPTAAAKIKMHKLFNGYRAQYVISNDNFHAYLDSIWNEYGQRSVVKRGEMSGDNVHASPEEMELIFSDLGWKPLENAVMYHSPTEPDGGGATYYLDASTGVAYQRTGYW